MSVSKKFPGCAALALVIAAGSLATLLIGCAWPRGAASPYTVQLGDEKVAILIIRPGEDSQARILAFDGVPFGSFVGTHVQPTPYRVPVAPGMHEVRVFVPGPCTYYDGLPGPGSSFSNLRFMAKAGVQYQVSLDSRPSQILTSTSVHVYEVVKAPLQFRSVEETLSTEPDPSSCPHGRGLAR